MIRGHIFPRKDADTLAKALKMLGVQVRWNLRKQIAEIKRGQDAWKSINDRLESALREEISREFSYAVTREKKSPLHYGRERWTSCFNAILNGCEIDPFEQWLKSIPKWDSVNRVCKVLRDLFGCDEDILTQWASRYIFLGVVQRTLGPGCKLDEIPVLVGPQGIGKSLMLRLALPQDDPGLFSDGLVLSGTDKERAEALLGRAIVEASEMRGSTRGELESIKSFLTRQDDGIVRLSYRKNPEPSPRRCVIIGTTNKEECLPNDPSGNRRFVPIICHSGNGWKVEKYLNHNRTQLWAEALWLYSRKGIRANLPQRLYTQQAERVRIHRSKDGLVEDFVEQLETEVGEGLSLTDIANRASSILQRLPGWDKRIALVLRARRWENKQVQHHGRRQRVWIPPQKETVINMH